MTELNLFDLNKPADLFKIIHEVYVDYIKTPTEKDFLILALGLTHLREWIAEGDWEGIKCKKQSKLPLTDGEKFFEEIYHLDEFKVIQGLCNKGKHFITTPTGWTPNTSQEIGLRAGIGKAGDGLDQKYFLIDGKDSRDYFIKLIGKYNQWFSKHGL
ncbi:MAG: hypothetical protein NPIRA03_09290 [Nitrospirales bacterium]|nr:MAG: hypothetical protein NPIRA03_09290 [Nitrospirales bacterium]